MEDFKLRANPYVAKYIPTRECSFIKINGDKYKVNKSIWVTVKELRDVWRKFQSYGFTGVEQWKTNSLTSQWT